jgi:hypothetical protein
MKARKSEDDLLVSSLYQFYLVSCNILALIFGMHTCLKYVYEMVQSIFLYDLLPVKHAVCACGKQTITVKSGCISYTLDTC